jgi:DNA helicase TIP49 (TBP-interacting protein)
LSCYNNNISVLDVTNLTKLTTLECSDNNIIQSTADTIAGKIIANNISNGDMFILEQTSGNLTIIGNLLTLQDDYNWDIQ